MSRPVGGRPALPPEARREQAVNVRLTEAEAEAAAWAQAAATGGHRRVAPWVREVINASLRSPSVEEKCEYSVSRPGAGLSPQMRELVAQLRRIGVNLNQVARFANGQGEIPGYAAKLLPLVDEVLHMVRRAATEGEGE